MQVAQCWPAALLPHMPLTPPQRSDQRDCTNRQSMMQRRPTAVRPTGRPSSKAHPAAHQTMRFRNLVPPYLSIRALDQFQLYPPPCSAHHRWKGTSYLREAGHEDEGHASYDDPAPEHHRRPPRGQGVGVEWDDAQKDTDHGGGETKGCPGGEDSSELWVGGMKVDRQWVWMKRMCLSPQVPYPGKP